MRFRHCRKSDEGSAYVVLLRRRKDAQEDGWKRIENSNLGSSATAKETSYRPRFESPLAIRIRVEKSGAPSRELFGLSIGIETRVHVNDATVTCLCRSYREALVVHPLLLGTKQTYFM